MIGCYGTSRLPGAGHIVKKDGAMWGPSKISSPKSLSSSGSPNAKSESCDQEPFHFSDPRKAPIPNKYERPIMGIKTSKNFVTANAVEAILQVPRVTEVGELNYLKKEDFGKIPQYLTQVKEEIKRENEMIAKYVKEQMGEIDREPDLYEEISDEERGQLISDLKQKWADTNAKYQRITHLVLLDTAGQIRRKEAFERELDVIEKDIEKLTRHGPVLIKK